MLDPAARDALHDAAEGDPRHGPEPARLAPGCRFAPRCDYAFDRCSQELPPLFEVGAQESACWLCESGPRAVRQVAAT